MRFILLNQYYPPDLAPTGVMLSHLACHLVQSGHEVTVLCSEQHYGKAPAIRSEAESSPGGQVSPLPTFPLGKRFHHKLLHYGSFYALLAWKLMVARPKPEVVIALTTPPYLGLHANVIGLLRGWRTVDWVMDLYPDVMKAHGMVRETSMTYRFLQALQGWSLRRAALVVTLGPDMQALSQGYRRNARGQETWVPLWSERRSAAEGEIQDYREGRGIASSDTVFLYSGNLGLGHRFDEWLQAIETLGPDSAAKWIFSGGGAQRRKVEAFTQQHADLPVKLMDYVPDDLLAVHLAAGDVHLASLDPPWDGCMVPSKVQGSFAAGRLVLFVGSRDCSLGQWIGESGGGWVVPPNDPAALLVAIQEALDPEQTRIPGERARAYAHTHFDRSTNPTRLAHEIIKAST